MTVNFFKIYKTYQNGSLVSKSKLSEEDELV